MSVGFGFGPLAAGALAQWAPAPTIVPYVPHLVLSLGAALLVLFTRETRNPPPPRGALRWRVPGIRARRFLTLVVPLAPWVFASASIALAYLPGLVADRLAGYVLVFSAVVTFVTAGAGILVQPLARRMVDPGGSQLVSAALATVVAGMLIAAAAAAAAQPVLVVAAALVLGAGYGGCQVAGLREVQRLADPDHLAGLTAAYQAISYVGFVVPFPLAVAARFLPASGLLVGVAALAALTLAWTHRAAAMADREPDVPVAVALGDQP